MINSAICSPAIFNGFKSKLFATKRPKINAIVITVHFVLSLEEIPQDKKNELKALLMNILSAKSSNKYYALN